MQGAGACIPSIVEVQRQDVGLTLVVQAGYMEMAQSEELLLEALMSKDPNERSDAEWVIRGCFLLQQEIRSVLHCYGLPGVVRCVAVLILEEVGLQVKGMGMDHFDMGDLGRVCL
jgi:hypothetical protein